MCGIAGIVGRDRIGAEQRSLLGRMLERLVHRGPDDSGEYVAEHVALGHRRLGVIDLDTGHQPIANEDGSIRAVVNGEFYNFLELREDLSARGHKFRSTGDSECLVHLYEEYGDGCLDHINGMFAFALWDEPRQRLMLARDRLGIKPLYYAERDGLLIFASELKAVIACPAVRAELDPTALIDYLTFGFIPSPKTIFKNVRKLSPGSKLDFVNGRSSIRSFWDLRFSGFDERPVEDIADDLWSQVKNATRPRLLADVPIGAFLSGGLDSGAVVGAMAQTARNRIATLTCGFEEAAFDERDRAREIAKLFDTEHRDGVVRPDAAAIVDTLAWHFDEPFADPSAIPTYYLSQHARQFVTVALSGDGGDEILAGYRRYRFDCYEERIRRFVPRQVRRHLCAPLARWYPKSSWLPRPLRAASMLRNLSTDGATAHGWSIATMLPQEARAMLDPDLAEATKDYDPIDRVRALYRHCDAPDHLSKCQYVDIRFGLADGILTKVDRASMAHALEVRTPLLDHRLVEFAWSIPPRHRIRGRWGKFPLRRAVARNAAPALAGRRKSGFDVPLDDWFTGSLQERVDAALSDGNGVVGDWLSRDAVRRLWKVHVTGRARNGATLWKILMLDAWRNHFCKSAGPLVTPTARLTCTR